MDPIESGIFIIVLIGKHQINHYVLEDDRGLTEYADIQPNLDVQILTFLVFAIVLLEQEEVEELVSPVEDPIPISHARYVLSTIM